VTKVALIGANGQVGAELCLLLAQRPEVDLVAICRNKSGSAFLRWQGIACRHGRVANPVDAARMLGDCDVVVNCALATGTPAEIRHAEQGIIHNIFAYAKASATVIHFSTQSVYGDPRPNRRIRRRNAYARAKLASERHVEAEQRAFRKPAYILRLGHVCGTMQEISHTIRGSIRLSAVVLPSVDCSSNTVYTAAIAAAILQIMRRDVRPGTYDLMNTPLWTWRQVFEYEASRCQVPFEPLIAAQAPQRSWGAAGIALTARLASSLATAPPIVELAAKAFAHAPETLNRRALAWWNTKRARAQIAALNCSPQPPEYLTWRTNGVNFFPADRPTRSILETWQATPNAESTIESWPDDLPDAGEKSGAL
jgi:nucleoside-diphosphate-sugar epimerase